MEYCSSICNFNWIGGIIGAVVAYFIGAFWYSKLFLGNAWLKSQNKTEEDMKNQSSLIPMLVSAVYHLALAMLIVGLRFLVKDCPALFWISITVLIITTVLAMLQGALYENKSIKLWGITAGHEAVVIVTIALFVFYLNF